MFNEGRNISAGVASSLSYRAGRDTKARYTKLEQNLMIHIWVQFFGLVPLTSKFEFTLDTPIFKTDTVFTRRVKEEFERRGFTVKVEDYETIGIGTKKRRRMVKFFITWPKPEPRRKRRISRLPRH